MGFSGGCVLNDWADRATDRTVLAARAQHEDYARQLRRERRFTGTRPIAAGIVSPGAALAFALALVGISAAVILTFSAPHRWYVLGALGVGLIGEPLYCAIKRKQRRFPAATFFHGIVLAMCPVAGYLAVRRPDLTALFVFTSLYFWEVGFNQLYDTVDAENDRRRGITTLSSAVGLRFVAVWTLVLSVLTTASFISLWWSSRSGPAMLVGICAAGLLLIGTDALLLLRRRLGVASAAIGIHLIYLPFVVAATALDTALKWLSVY